MRKAGYLLAVLLIAAIVGIGLWRTGANQEAGRSEFLMGTYMEIRAYGRNPQKAIDVAFERISQIEQLMSTNLPNSEVSQINQQAGLQPVQVSEETFDVVAQAIKYGQLTDGRFDLTIQPVVTLWGINSPKARVPSNQEIADALPLVDYSAVEINHEQRTVYLPKVGMGIDLGGIAKGYAADEVASIMRRYGINSAFINLGGNLYVVGNSPQNDSWRIGIQDPLDERSAYMAVVQVSDQTLVTSGGYERFLEVGGQRYHHILDPLTGYPAKSDLVSSTIISTSSMDADALSTSVFILGLDTGLRLIENLENTEAVFIDAENNVYVSSGLVDKVTIVDEKYHEAP